MIPIELLKIKDELRDGYHILCRVHINGKEFRMLVDTGASMTIFDINKTSEISQNETESNNQIVFSLSKKELHSKYIVIDEMRIGDIIIKNYKTLLINIDGINQFYKDNSEPTIDGIIGGDILREYKAIIDYENRYMILTS